MPFAIYQIEDLLTAVPSIKNELERRLEIHRKRRFADWGSRFVVRLLEEDFEYAATPLMQLLLEKFKSRIKEDKKVTDHEELFSGELLCVDGKIAYVEPFSKVSSNKSGIYGIRIRTSDGPVLDYLFNILRETANEFKKFDPRKFHPLLTSPTSSSQSKNFLRLSLYRRKS